MVCPRCDDQGNVIAVRIIATGENVFLCDECDALWRKDVPVSVDSFVDFSTYVDQFGLKGRWDEIEAVKTGDLPT